MEVSKRMDCPKEWIIQKDRKYGEYRRKRVAVGLEESLRLRVRMER
jgi:hypothetical protein